MNLLSSYSFGKKFAAGTFRWVSELRLRDRRCAVRSTWEIRKKINENMGKRMKVFGRDEEGRRCDIRVKESTR